MKAKALMKKIGTANGKPCSLVVVEETVAAQQGCHLFECTCGMKFWTQYYAAFHVKKSHAGEKPADRLKICCDLNLDLNVLASIYINVSDNIHTYLLGSDDETLKRKREACEMVLTPPGSISIRLLQDSSSQAKRLSTADIRNRIPLSTPTKVQFPAKLVDTAHAAFPAGHLSSSPFLSSPATRFSKIVDIPHPAFPAGHLSLSPAISSATKCFSISPVPLLHLKVNNSPHSKDDNTWISCKPPTITRPTNDTSYVQMKSADNIRMKEHVEHDYRALSSSDQPLEDSSNNMLVDKETQRYKDPSCVTEESEQNGQMMIDDKPLDIHGVNGLEVAIATETIIDRLDLVADDVEVGVENRGKQSSNENSESSNKSVADTDTLKYVLDMIAEQDGNTPESEKVDGVSCRSGQQNSVLSTLIDDFKNMATDKIPAGELAVDDSIVSRPFRAFQKPAINSHFQQNTKTCNMVVAVQKSHNPVHNVNPGQIYDSSQLQTDIADAACFKANTRQTDGNFTATDNENGRLDDRSNCSDHDSRSGDHGIPQSIGRGKRKIINKNCTICPNCKR